MNTRHGRPALIIANGDIPGAGGVRSLARFVLRRGGPVVCADGGYRHAVALGIRPSLILGDLDSLPAGARRPLHGPPVVRDPDQESTDLEKAVRYCIAAGCASADIVGVSGGRIDHTAAALGCLRRFGRTIALRLIDRSGEARLLGRRERIRVRAGESFSLIPLGRCRGVMLKGAAYPLDGGTLEAGVREGVSNRALGTWLEIRHAAGTLLFYRFDPEGGPGTRRPRAGAMRSRTIR